MPKVEQGVRSRASATTVSAARAPFPVEGARCCACGRWAYRGPRGVLSDPQPALRGRGLQRALAPVGSHQCDVERGALAIGGGRASVPDLRDVPALPAPVDDAPPRSSAVVTSRTVLTGPITSTRRPGTCRG